MKNGFTFKAHGKAGFHHLVMAMQQLLASGAHTLPPEPGCRCQMGMAAKQFAQLGLADTGGFGECRHIAKQMRFGADAGAKPIEQLNIAILATIKEIGAAAFAGTKAVRLRLSFRFEEADVLGFGRPRRARRQTINSRRQHADQEFAVIAAGPRQRAIP